jgi:hypothetical protein
VFNGDFDPMTFAFRVLLMQVKPAGKLVVIACKNLNGFKGYF